MENHIADVQKIYASPFVIATEDLLVHWQGHRRLTRRAIEAFPENEFFNYSIGGMRPFSEMVLEMIGLASSGMKGVLTGEWDKVGALPHHTNDSKPATKAAILKLWDELTANIEVNWSKIPLSRFHEIDFAYGEYEGPIYSFILYWIDNEIHHRAQATVYLRSLGIEPPYFWLRD